MNGKVLQVILTLESDDVFSVDIYEPESGEIKMIRCHDNGDTITAENKEITDEIRTWISIMREEESD